MLDKLSAIEQKYAELRARLDTTETYGDPALVARLNREVSELTPVVETFVELKKRREELRQAESLLSDPDLAEMAKEEYAAAKAELPVLEQRLKILLLPQDPNDGRGVVMELRAGVGGEEAALFAAELRRMYGMYAERRGWSVETANESMTELGGVKEASFLIEGKDVYSRLKFESGVHRVQRVPKTESGGRIHTSTVTVAVLPQVDEVEFVLNPADLRIDTFRASGAGGQHINKTESAIRITHIPTGTVVECQDERSQYKNKDRAMQILRSRLYEAKLREQTESIASERRSQVGSGMRNERIRTYNFPQGRMTDHRIGLTLYQLEDIMNGALDAVIDPLILDHQAQRLRQQSE